MINNKTIQQSSIESKAARRLFNRKLAGRMTANWLCLSLNQFD